MRTTTDVVLLSLLLLTSCPILPMLKDSELESYRSKPQTLVGARAVTADQVATLVDPLAIGTERVNFLRDIFPAVVDKENWRFRPTTSTPPVERVIQEDGPPYLEVRPAPFVTPVLCLQLERIRAADYATLEKTIRDESLKSARPKILRANIRNWLFTVAQIEALVSLMGYREESDEARFILEPRRAK